MFQNSFWGLGMIFGPFLGGMIGGNFGPDWGFCSSSWFYFAAAILISQTVPETLSEEKRRNAPVLDAAAMNPLRFLKLFKNRTTATLALALGFQDAGNFANVYDIQNLFFFKTLNYAPQDVGNFSTLWGVTQLIGGRAAKYTIKAWGGQMHTTVSNLLTAATYFCWAGARTSTGMGLVLVLAVLQHQRSSVVQAQLREMAVKKGVGQTAEVTAAMQSWLAVLKVLWPLVYARLYVYFTTAGRNQPGMPYYMIGVLALASEGLLRTL